MSNFTLIHFHVSSQGLKCESFAFNTSIVLDTLPVEESSIEVKGELSFVYDLETNSISLSADQNIDSVRICFRTISPNIYQPLTTRDIEIYEQGRVSRQPSASSIAIIPKDEIFSFNDFETSGAITRGVTFGNRQNLFVNSALNLQLEGQLAEDLFVSASITDQNIPYQPEGNTQQIRDFDNVFIKLYNDDFALTAGDVVLTNPVRESYFLQYYKNVQGLNLEYKYEIGDKWKARSIASGSAAKGQFSSAQIQPIEGVQGPYKLTGPNGERFIIVLASSEKVFIDGKLMERGFDRDYVIDYNLGEVTFSNSILITRFTRIRIDFEYAEQYYSRSNLNATQELTNGKVKLYANFYQEKDNPQNSLGFNLEEDDVDALVALGDNNGVGVIDGAELTDFIENAILYLKRDSIIDTRLFSIFEQSNDPQLATFKVVFTDTGAGNGDYLLKSTTANGRVYEWIAPIGGISQGSYSPVRILPLPNKKQMAVIGGKVNLSVYESLQHELALSQWDQNLYSDLEDSDNDGYAWRTILRSKGRSLGAYNTELALSFESVGTNFQWVDRFRSIEYDRNWGYDFQGDSIARADNILSLELNMVEDDLNTIEYDFNYRNRKGVINGYQNEMKVIKEVGPFLSQSYGYIMQNSSSNLISEWYRLKQDIRLNNTKINPGYSFELDQQRTYLSDTLFSSLMHFYAHDFYVQSGDSLKTILRADYIYRKDQSPQNGIMAEYTEANEFKLGARMNLFGSQIIGVTANYRTVYDEISESLDQNVLGKLDWKSQFRDILTRNFTYSTANIRELRREFVFINVPTGEGTHTWRDENDDGIQDLNEFYEAINADEKSYAKIFSPTDEYINAFQSTFLNVMEVVMPKDWNTRGGAFEQFSKLSFRANVRINFKSSENNLLTRINPFAKFEDSIFLAAQNQSRYGLFYNRNGSGLAFDINRSNGKNKSLLTNGFELRERLDWQSNIRFGLGQDFTARLQGGFGKTINESDFLESRNFAIARRNWAPQLVWQPSSSFRLSGKLERRVKDEEITEIPNKSEITDYSIESTWVRASKGNLNAEISWISIDFDGERNSYLGYELLEGLLPGQNQKWNLNWQQSLKSGLQLTIQYNGRKSGNDAPIHTGTMQLTAFF